MPEVPDQLGEDPPMSRMCWCEMCQGREPLRRAEPVEREPVEPDYDRMADEAEAAESANAWDRYSKLP